MTRAISAGLKAHYALGTTTITTCWKATLRNGTVVAATALDRDIVFAGVTYQSVAAYMPSEVVNTADLSVDNLELEGFLRSPSITEEDILAGTWDYAAVEMFEVNYKDLTMGRNLIRKGTLGEVKAGRSKFNVELRGLLQKLTKRIIKLTQKDCIHTLGDARCKVDLGPWTVGGVVSEIGDDGDILTDWGRGEIANHFTNGLITFTSGANAGLSMEVKKYVPGRITLHEQMPFEIQVGDTYTLVAGCTHRFHEDCITKFNNGVNFGGFPHVPLSSVYAGPNSGTSTNSDTATSSGGGGGTSPPPSPTPPVPGSPGPAPAPPPATEGGSWGSDAAFPLRILTDRWISIGGTTEYYLSDGVWGAAGLTRGTYTGTGGTTFESAEGWNYTYGPNGEISWRMAWKWPTGSTEVKAYPSALIGNKPGFQNSWVTPGGFYIELPDGTFDDRAPSGKTHNGNFFPMQANGALPTINAAVGGINHLVGPSGRGHLSYDIWLQNTSEQAHGFGAPPITHEIMIPLDLWGHYGEHGYRNPAWYSHDETIQGILFHIYFVRNFFGGWTFVVFEPDIAYMPLTGTLNIAEFINKLKTMNGTDSLPMAAGTEWLVSVELGVEPVDGVGDLEVQNFRVWKP